jgi:HD-like signal output (HDOD) protein
MNCTEDKKRMIQNLLVSQPIDIPVFHEVALRLQQMMNDNSYRIDEVIKLVNEDTALSAEMLKHANSTYNSGMAPITTIKNAIVRLGSQQVVNLAFTASMANSRSDNPFINAQLKNLWHHSHAVAITSAWLAIQTGLGNEIPAIDADEVYLAGLLHAIGKLYLLKSIDELIKAGELEIEHCSIDEIINELNTKQGIRVMQHWHMPEIYVNSVERHDCIHWQCGTNDHLVAAVRLSCKIHNYLNKGIELTETCEAFDLVKDELTFLEIDDAAHVCDIVKAITD